jgi:hypothetical protein
MSHPGFFLLPIATYRGKIPFIVTDLLSHLRAINAFSQKGIFRVAGVKSEVAVLVEHLDKDRVRDWSKFTNPNTIAAACKRWFHDQAAEDPLIPKALADEFMEVPDAEKTPEEVVRDFKKWFTKVSTLRKMTMAFLIRALKEVAETPTAAMNAKNLGVVFAPCLFFSDPAAPIESILELTTRQAAAIQALIVHCNDVFEEALKFERFLMSDYDIHELRQQPSV